MIHGLNHRQQKLKLPCDPDSWHMLRMGLAGWSVRCMQTVMPQLVCNYKKLVDELMSRLKKPHVLKALSDELQWHESPWYIVKYCEGLQRSRFSSG